MIGSQQGAVHMVTRNELPMDDIRSLVESGDIKLKDTRADFQRVTGKATTLSDDDVIACHAAQDDDYGIEDVVNRMMHLQSGNEALAFTEGEASKPISSKVIPIAIRSSDSTIEGYEYGAMVSGAEDVGRYFRIAFNAENPEPWKHADDVIIDIIRRNPQQPGVDDEDYNEAILEQMAEFEPQQLPDQSVQDVVNQSVSYLEKSIDETARLLNKNEKLLSLLQTIDTANKTVYMGPITVYNELLAMIGNGFDFFARIAEPGVRKVDLPEGTNEPWDIYIKYETNASGTRKAKQHSQVDEIALRLTPVVEAIKSSDEHKKFINKEERDVAVHTADKANSDSTKTLIKRNFRQ